MEKSRIINSFIVRVEETYRGKLIIVQDLKTKELLEFDSWTSMCRHLHLLTALENLDVT